MMAHYAAKLNLSITSLRLLIRLPDESEKKLRKKKRTEKKRMRRGNKIGASEKE